METVKLYIVLAVCFVLHVGSFAQNSYKGFIPDGSTYSVLSEPSTATKGSQLVYGNKFCFPFLKVDEAMLLLSNDAIEPFVFTLPEEIKNCEDPFFLNGQLICKYGNSVKCFDGKKVRDVFSIQDDRYNIYPANEDFFYFVKHRSDSSFVYLFEISTKKFSKLFDTPFQIDNLAGSGRESFVTSAEMIYFVSKEICTLVEIVDSKVQSIDFYSDGAFYSTEKACYYMGLPGKSYPFLLGDIKQVMLVDNRLYLLFGDGLLSVIDHADKFQTLLDKVMNESGQE